MKNFYKILLASMFFAVALMIPEKAFATPISASSAAFVHDIDKSEEDNRAVILREFLLQYNSPLADSAETFVREADRNNLDWRLVAAISGVESWFGQRIPPNSYNGWGYGVYGNNVRRFNSWDEAIILISSDLRVKYMNKWKATDVQSIGRIYAADPKWSGKVQHFLNKIDAFIEQRERVTLSLSI